MTSTEEKLNEIVRNVTDRSEFKEVEELSPIFDKIETLSVDEQCELLSEILCYYGGNIERGKQIEIGFTRPSLKKAKAKLWRG